MTSYEVDADGLTGVISAGRWGCEIRLLVDKVYFVVRPGTLLLLSKTPELVQLVRSVFACECPPAVLADWIDENPESVRLREGDVVGLLRECW